MTTISVRNTRSTTILQDPQIIVQVKREWLDSWQTVPYLEFVSASEVVSPGVGAAQLQYRYGAAIKREDQPTFRAYLPLDLSNWFVRILTVSRAGTNTLWVGVIDDVAYDAHGEVTAPQGDQVLHCYGLGHILDRVCVSTAYAWNNIAVQQLGYCPVFNERAPHGGAMEGNRTELPTEDGVYVFGGHSYWSNLQIVNYLLYYYGPAQLPVRLTGTYTALDNILTMQRLEGLSLKSCLDHLISRQIGLGWTVRTTGSGPIEIHVFPLLGQPLPVGDAVIPANPEQTRLELDRSIHIEQALVTTKRTTQFDLIEAVGERVKSCVTLSLTDGTLEPGWTPEEEAAYKAGDTAEPTDADACDAERGTDKHARVYQLYRVPATWGWTVGNGEGGEGGIANPAVSSIDGTLDPDIQGGWLTPGKSFERHLPLYRDDALSDSELLPPFAIVRHEDRYVQVDNPGVDAGGELLPKCSVRMADRELGVVVNPGTANHILALNHWTTTPLFSDSFDTPGRWTVNGGEYWEIHEGVAQSLAAVTDPQGLLLMTLAAPVEIQSGRKYSVTYTLLNHPDTEGFTGSFWFRLGGATGTPRTAPGTYTEEITATGTDALTFHASFNSFGAMDNVSINEVGEEPVTGIQPVYDYSTLIATVCVQTDQRARVRVEAPTYRPDMTAPRTLVMDVDGAELWYVAPGTVMRVENGALVRHDGGVVRDDTDKLWAAAAMAAAWYTQGRACVQLRYSGVWQLAPLGAYVINASASWQVHEIGTVITSRTWTIGSRGPETMIETGFAEIDSGGGFDIPGMSDARSVGREIRRMRREIESTRRHVGNLPVRFIGGGGGGIGGSMTVQVDRHSHSGTADGGWRTGWMG